MLGIRLATRHGETAVANAYAGGPAQRAGMSAGDTIVALDGLRADEKIVKAMLERRRPGDTVRLHAFRRDELLAFDVVLDAAPASEASIRFDEKPRASVKRLRDGWLR